MGTLGRLGHIWEDNIKMELQDVKVWTGFTSLTKDPVLGCCEHGNESLDFI
jgi:hypothetical protein